MTTLEYLFLGLLVGLLVIGLAVITINKKLKEDLYKTQFQIKEQRVKAEFMIRELNKVYGEAKNKTYCLGNIDALRWVTGELKDGNYWGYLQARKQAAKVGK